MTITDAQRHRLHTKLDQVLGEEDAAVLISHLLPSGWSDVARTRDLDELGARIDLRFEAQDSKFEAMLERGLHEQTGRYLLATGALMTVVTTLQTVVIATLG